MTRLAILADIHGNPIALQTVIDDMQQFQPDAVVVAGDLINFGPRSDTVIDMVRAKRWAVIRGNNEFYLLDYDTPRAPESWQHYTMPPFLRKQLGLDRWRYIAMLPDTLRLCFHDAPPVRVLHGRPDNPWVSIFPDTPDTEVAAAYASVQETAIICAHTHIPLDRVVDGKHIINPGSVGAPPDGIHHSSYMIADGDANGWQVIAHQYVPFDIERVLQQFEDVHYVDKLGITGQLVIEENRQAKILLLPFWAWANHHYPTTPRDFWMVDEFLAADDILDFTPDPYRKLYTK